MRWHYRHGAITGWPNVLWSDPHGATLIVRVTRPGTAASRNGDLTPEIVGVVTGHRFQPLSGLPAGNMLAW